MLGQKRKKQTVVSRANLVLRVSLTNVEKKATRYSFTPESKYKNVLYLNGVRNVVLWHNTGELHIISNVKCVFCETGRHNQTDMISNSSCNKT